MKATRYEGLSHLNDDNNDDEGDGDDDDDHVEDDACMPGDVFQRSP